MIYKKVANRESPYDIVKKVEKVLDEDAEVYIENIFIKNNKIFFS